MEHQFTRGSKAYLADKANRLVKLGNNAETDLPRVARVKRIIIELDENSQPLYAETKWHEYDETPTGKRVNSEEKLMLTNQADLIGLGQALAAVLDAPFINGYVRDIMGYNHQPPYDVAGNPIADTIYNTSTLPSKNYKSHNADGTPIDPNGEGVDVAPYKA